jgi:hypothetical protein
MTAFRVSSFLMPAPLLNFAFRCLGQIDRSHNSDMRMLRRSDDTEAVWCEGSDVPSGGSLWTSD